MLAEELVKLWFSIWENGNFEDLPLAEDFIHVSPYGTVEGRANYMNLVMGNKDMFLGNRFEIEDEVYAENKACIRYTMVSETGNLRVSEWIYTRENLIQKIVAYYNLQEDKAADRGIEIQ